MKNYIIFLVFIVSLFTCKSRHRVDNTTNDDVESKKQGYEDYNSCERNFLLVDSLFLVKKLDTFYYSVKNGNANYILLGSVFNPNKTHCVSLCDYHFEDSSIGIAFKLNIWHKTEQKWVKVVEQDTLKFTYGINPFHDSDKTFIRYEDVNKDGYKDLMILQGITAIHPTEFWYLWLYNPQSHSLDFVKGFEELGILDYCYLDNKLTIFHKNTNWGVFSLKQVGFSKDKLIIEKEYKWQIDKKSEGIFTYKEFGKEVNKILDFSYKDAENFILKDKSLCIKDRWF